MGRIVTLADCIDAIVIFEVPSKFIGTLSCLSVPVWSDTQSYLRRPERRWIFEIMLVRKAFISIPKCLDVEYQKMPVTVTGRKCGAAGYLSSFCPEKMAPGVMLPADQNLPVANLISVSSVMGMPATGICAVKLAVGSNFRTSLPGK